MIRSMLRFPDNISSIAEYEKSLEKLIRTINEFTKDLNTKTYGQNLKVLVYGKWNKTRVQIKLREN